MREKVIDSMNRNVLDAYLDNITELPPHTAAMAAMTLTTKGGQAGDGPIDPTGGQGGEFMGRIIKRYGNRKLYDTRESRYITLEEIAGFVRDGEDVTVIDNESGGDLTTVAFAQIILEEERRKGGSLPVVVLRDLIRSEGERAEAGLGSFGDLPEFPVGISEALTNGSTQGDRR